MQKINDCFNKIKKDCFRFILSQETKKDKFKNKDKMIKSFLIPVSFWIAKKTNKKKTIYNWFSWWAGNGQNYNLINFNINFTKILQTKCF